MHLYAMWSHSGDNMLGMTLTIVCVLGSCHYCKPKATLLTTCMLSAPTPADQASGGAEGPATVREPLCLPLAEAAMPRLPELHYHKTDCSCVAELITCMFKSIKLSVHDLMASQLVFTSQGSVQHGGTNRNDTCSSAGQQYSYKGCACHTG